jgi:hypothetical protein
VVGDAFVLGDGGRRELREVVGGVGGWRQAAWRTEIGWPVGYAAPSA